MNQCVVFILEEPSMKAMLEELLPRMGLSFTYKFRVCEGKQDLESRASRIIKSYDYAGNYYSYVFIVVRDKDTANCMELKQRLLKAVSQTEYPCYVRIVCQELESWYFAQLDVLKRVFPQIKISKNDLKTLQKNPECFSAHKLDEYTKKQYNKTKSARAFGLLLDPNSEKSPSFRVFIRTLREIDNGGSNKNTEECTC